MFRKLTLRAAYSIAFLAGALFTATPASAQPVVGQAPQTAIPNAWESTTIILSSDTATLSRGAHTLAAESGTADDFCTVVTTGLVVGHRTVVRADAGDTITIKTGGSCNITTDTGEDLIITGAKRAVIDVTAAGADASIGGDVTSAELASTANGEGAALIGVEDAAGYYTSDDVEGALAEAGAGQFARAVNDITALRALNGASLQDGQIVLMRYHTNVRDGGGGFFRFYKTRAGTDDGGIFIRPADYVSEGNIGLFVRVEAEGNDRLSVKWYGAQADITRVYSATGVGADMTAGSAALNDDAGTFTAADVGKIIIVLDAGNLGPFNALITTITGYTSATDVTLADVAINNSTDAEYFYGTDDSPAINAAFDTERRYVSVPAGEYMLGSQLVNDVNSRAVFGDGLSNAEFQGGSKFYCAFDDYCVLTQRAWTVWRFLSFHGIRLDNSGAIKAARTANTDDIDVYVSDNVITQMHTAIYVIGRSPYIDNNEIATVNVALQVEWPTSGVIADGDHHDVPYGWRAGRFTRNRLHSVSEAGVWSIGTNRQHLRNFMIANNMVDVGDVLFKGGINSSTISDNQVFLSGEATGIIRCEAGCDDLKLMGNKFEGQEIDATDTPSYMVYLVDEDGDGTISGLQMIGESYKYADADMVYIDAPLTDSAFIGNTFIDAGRIVAGSAIINALGDWTDVTVTGNNFVPGSATAYIDSNGFTFTRVLSQANSITINGQTFIGGTPLDGGGNVTQESAQLGVGCLSATRPLQLCSTSAIMLELTRTGSTAGSGFRAIVDGGNYIDTTYIPSGANEGYLAIGNANTDLGSGTFPMKDIYANGGLLVDNQRVVKERMSAVADTTITWTAGNPSITPNSACTIANGATPTVTELQECLVELKFQIETLKTRFEVTTGHGLIAD